MTKATLKHASGQYVLNHTELEVTEEEEYYLIRL